jgi:hypothetical protein
MDNFEDRFNTYIQAHPRQTLKLMLAVTCLVWVSAVAVLGVILYFVLAKIMRLPWWGILGIGMVVLMGAILVDAHYAVSHLDLRSYIVHGFASNQLFWKLIFTHSDYTAVKFVFQDALIYVVGVPLFFAGVLAAVDLIKDCPHLRVIGAMQKGEHLEVNKELNDKEIVLALKKLNDSATDGTVLGVSTYTGKSVIIPDQFVNQILLVLGTTGAGKTVTLRRFYKRAITKGYPLIVVDGKPTDENVAWLSGLARKHGRKFYGFNCSTYSHYDPLANGGYSELKDKIISLKDQWENDYYKSIAEDYLQTTFEVLQRAGTPFDLKRVVACLNHEDLTTLTRSLKDAELIKRVDSLASYERKDITGLQAHLNLLIHSELGQYFIVDENAITIPKIIDEDAVVYFALPALRFPSFSKVLGKLVINDIKAAIDRHIDANKRVFMIFDEFSVFAGEQVLNLVNMGRGKGVHAIFGTQGLADLDRVDTGFKSQVMNCANTIICHRLNDQESAEAVTSWIGTKDAFVVSTQFNPNQTDAGVGSIGHTKEFIVHPDQIKQGLRTGDAYCVSKVRQFSWVKVRVAI